MHAYIINLDEAKDRWAFVEQTFAGTRFMLCRVSAVNGKALKPPITGYSERLYHWRHGRPTNLGAVGCYFSHIKAMEAFLATDDAHALIGEDDLILKPDFQEVLEAALGYARHWNILRVTGLGEGRGVKVAKLVGPYSLSVGLGRLKGTGAYIIDRAAARALVDGLLPMCLPIDHALDREWFYGLRAACIQPFPASQTEHAFKSSIQQGESRKLASWRRYLTTYPYQIWNETTRWLFRSVSCLRLKLASPAR